MKTDLPAPQKVAYTAIVEEALTQIRLGAFLTVQSGDTRNVMTIGWASLGNLWARPAIMVMVRPSRHTYGIIEQSAEFTVSVPAAGTMKKELTVCGTKSGRDLDKFETCGFTTAPGLKTRTPVINIPGIHCECKIIYKTPLKPEAFTADYANLYTNKDYHTLYFGEILEAYRKN